MSTSMMLTVMLFIEVRKTVYHPDRSRCGVLLVFVVGVGDVVLQFLMHPIKFTVGTVVVEAYQESRSYGVMLEHVRLFRFMVPSS